MRYIDLTDTEAAASVFCRICSEDGMFYKPLSEPEFADKFTGIGKAAIAAYDGDTCVGFAAGNTVTERRTAYLTFICVLPQYRRHGIGNELLSMLEKKLSVHDIDNIEIVFHNPVGLEWFIPFGNGDAHPYIPGIDVYSDAYVFLKNRGYRDYAMQNAYYLRLGDYREPAACAAARENLRSKNIELTLYNPTCHHGLYELFDDIANTGWREYVLSNIDKPVVVAVDNNAGGLVTAYTGPLSIDATGRGNFCGIGTLKAYRGYGIGKLVFNEMCRRHLESGATYMSLYTGETNNARNIYEAAGFRIVRCFANQRKTLLK